MITIPAWIAATIAISTGLLCYLWVRFRPEPKLIRPGIQKIINNLSTSPESWSPGFYHAHYNTLLCLPKDSDMVCVVDHDGDICFVPRSMIEKQWSYSEHQYKINSKERRALRKAHNKLYQKIQAKKEEIARKESEELMQSVVDKL